MNGLMVFEERVNGAEEAFGGKVMTAELSMTHIVLSYGYSWREPGKKDSQWIEFEEQFEGESVDGIHYAGRWRVTGPTKGRKVYEGDAELRRVNWGPRVSLLGSWWARGRKFPKMKWSVDLDFVVKF